MTTIRKTISVTQQHEEWIQSQIASGNYASDSEVLRKKIERTAEIEAIRANIKAYCPTGSARQFSR